MRNFFLLLLLVVNLGFAQKELSKNYSYKVSNPYKVFDAKKRFTLQKTIKP